MKVSMRCLATVVNSDLVLMKDTLHVVVTRKRSIMMAIGATVTIVAILAHVRIVLTHWKQLIDYGVA
jgi:hypothetical protein